MSVHDAERFRPAPADRHRWSEFEERNRAFWADDEPRIVQAVRFTRGPDFLTRPKDA